MFLQMSKNLPTATIKDQKGKILGVGMLRAFNPMQAFSHTAEITCFLDREYTGLGLGKTLLEVLQKEGREKAIATILANISSLNPGSINFQKNNGFIECGCFKNAGIKNGELFDTVWMQKML